MPSSEPAIDCVFCQMIAGRLPASLVYEGPLVVAFLDRRPMTTGHTLVVPRRHRASLGDVGDAEGAAIWQAATRVARGAQARLGASGANLLLSDGESAGQEVRHAHLHVIPRYQRGDLSVTAAAWEQPVPTPDELSETAAILARALDPD